MVLQVFGLREARSLASMRSSDGVCVCRALVAGIWVCGYVERSCAAFSLAHARTLHRQGMDVACVRSVCEGSWKRHRGVFYLLFVAPVCVQVNGCLSARSAAESTARRTQKQVNLFECRFFCRCWLLLFVIWSFVFLFCFVSLRFCVCACAWLRIRIATFVGSLVLVSINERQSI